MNSRNEEQLRSMKCEYFIPILNLDLDLLVKKSISNVFFKHQLTDILTFAFNL